METVQGFDHAVELSPISNRPDERSVGSTLSPRGGGDRHAPAHCARTADHVAVGTAAACCQDDTFKS